jgi:Cation/multidrug efflux pump
MKISHQAVKHPVYVALLLIALIAFGIYSIVGMNVAFISSFDVPMVYVMAVYPGADAETIEKEIIEVFEDDFITLPNFSSMSSTASDSVAVTSITFLDGVDPNDMLPEVRNRISQFETDLPEGISGTPNALVGGIQMLPIMTFSVETGGDAVRLTSYINDEIKPQITKIPGVSTVSLDGDKEMEVEIKLDTDALSSHSISPLQIYQVLEYNNTSMPLGLSTYRDKNASVRFEGGYDSLEEIENLAIGATENGTIIRIKDVATVHFAVKEENKSITSEGKELIVVNVCKRKEGNTIEITNEIKRILEEANRDTQGAFRYNIVSDDSRVVNASIRSVLSSGALGVLIAVLIIFLILGDIQATLTIALSLPLSILFTFIGMRVMGISINLLSLSGLIIALGSVVDGSIVILEQIYRYYRMRKDGKPMYTVAESIFHGADDVGISIFGSVLTTVIVFVPITLLKGIVGQILHDVSVTYMLALSASLITAVTVIPFFLKLFLKEDRENRKPNLIQRIVEHLQNVYSRAVEWTLDKRRFVLVVLIAVLAITIWCIAQLGITFIPSTDNSDFYIEVEFPQNYTLDRVEEGMAEAERILRAEVPELKTLVNTAGGSNGIVVRSGSNIGTIHAVLVPVAERKRDIHEIIILMQRRISESIPDATVTVKNGGFDNLVGFISGGGGYGITISGTDLDSLYAEALRINARLKQDPEVMTTSISTTYDTYTATIDASYDYLSSLGIPSTEAAMTSAILFNGTDAGKYRKDGKHYPLRLVSNVTDEPISENTLNNLKIVTSNGITVSYGGISDFMTKLNLSSITHTDRATTITISATTIGESTSGVKNRMNAYLAENPLESGIDQSDGGINKLVADALPPILSALIIAWFLVYAVMVLQFENFKQPFLILATIPFCIIGVAVALIIASSSLNLVSMLGIVSLGGMAVNNGIILVDYFNLAVKKKRLALFDEKGIVLREEDNERGKLDYSTEYRLLRSSIVESCHSRLKSILMTALSTMLGVIPMAVGTGEGSEVYAPLGQAIAGGLLASTAISLFLIPILYYLMENRRLRRTYKISKKEAKNAIETN